MYHHVQIVNITTTALTIFEKSESSDEVRWESTTRLGAGATTWHLYANKVRAHHNCCEENVHCSLLLTLSKLSDVLSISHYTTVEEGYVIMSASLISSSHKKKKVAQWTNAMKCMAHHIIKHWKMRTFWRAWPEYLYLNMKFKGKACGHLLHRGQFLYLLKCQFMICGL